MYLITFIAVNVKRAMIPVPAARPSRPSVRLTPFAAPAMTKKRNGYQAHESWTFQSTTGIRTQVGRCWCRAANATPTVINARSRSFQRPESPSERLCVSLMKSSRKPIAPQASVTKSTVSAGTLYLLTARNAIVAVTRMSRPPITGVPCLSTCRSGPSSRIGCPNSFRRRNSMNFGPTMIEMTIETMAAMSTLVNGEPFLGGHSCERLRDRLEAHRARALDEHAVARLDHRAHRLEPLLERRCPPRQRHAFRALQVVVRERTDGDERVDAEAGGHGADLAVVARSLLAQLGHVAEDRDLPPPAGAIVEQRERGAHRDRVRVVAVVDEQAAAGERRLVAAPAREGHVDRGRPLEAERVERRERSGGVRRLVASGEAEADAAEPRPPVRDDGVLRRPEPHDANVLAPDGEPGGHDRRPARRQRLEELGLRARDALQVAHELEVHGPDVRHDADLRPGDRGEVGDLTEAAYRELDDAHLGVGLEPAERERDAELVVEARLGRDRPRLRSAKRGEDVLRRGLAHRAGDPDDAGGTPLPDRRAERGHGREGVVREERLRCPALSRFLEI